jgi:ParB family chromosome partitioning protein
MARELKLNLPPADDLFSTQEERDDARREKVLDIPLPEISDFPNHPFKVKVDEDMLEMAESIKQYGVLVPGLVRPKEGGGYEMVAGHRRKMASEMAERGVMPCIIRDLTDDEATIIMVDSNLQRERILPSEKAFAYKMKLDAMKRQGKRTDLTSTPLAGKLRGKESAEIIGETTGESKDQVRRYIRLTELIPQLLDMVDNAVAREKNIPQIAIRPAVELSYLPNEHQQSLAETIGSDGCTPSHEQAIKMRKFSEEGRLNEDVILSIMQEEKPNQVEQFKMPRDKITLFFAPGTPAQKIEDTIIKALEHYQRVRERQRNDAR